jgi:dTDP-4-dehydrorhamnose reductase
MSNGRVLIYGGKGALGSSLLEYFKKSGFVSYKIKQKIDLFSGH